jgi:hypothetical protein
LALVLVAALIAVVIVPLAADKAVASASPAPFQAGLIISDAVFYDGQAMTQAEIQAFLDLRIGTCANGRCLNVLTTPVESRPRAVSSTTGQVICEAFEGGSLSAAAIIYRAQVACGISAKVILVTLQKEQGLVTHRGPSENRLARAMGQNCPDTAPCATFSLGFGNQVYLGTRQLKTYKAARFARQPGNHAIQFHPNAECGSSNVVLQNFATTALYNYTPYQPNAAALVNLGAVGDSCSSYGNRNFFTFYTSWFGSPIISKPAEAFVNALYVDVLGRVAGGGELVNWGLAVTNGMPRSQVAGGFVSSDEFRLLKIDLAYREVLGREPEPAGRLSWLNGMRQGTLSPDDAYRVFMQSQEYFNSTGGAIEPFVGAVYARILKRTAAPSEVVYWASQANTLGRAAVVDRIWNSVETSRTRVADMYSIYLGRVPDQPGLEQWGGLALRFGDSWVRSAIMGSGEYLNRALARHP